MKAGELSSSGASASSTVDSRSWSTAEPGAKREAGVNPRLRRTWCNPGGSKQPSDQAAFFA